MVDAEIDAIVAETELSTNNEIPMEAQPAETVEATPPAPEEFEFEFQGKQIKAPREKILQWASRGYDAPNRIGELSNKLKDYEGRFKQYETYEKTYKPIDEWAKQNPDKWQSLVQGWQQAQLGHAPTPDAPQAQLPPELIQKINQFEERFSKQDQIETESRQRAADQGLDGEIQSIRNSFTNLDFDAPDESGNSLEFRILEHATKNGIPSFRAAFRDYCFDQLSSFSESKGRETAGVSSKTRAGLLGKNPAPRTGNSTPDLRGKNYDQIHQLILEKELGVTG